MNTDDTARLGFHQVRAFLTSEEIPHPFFPALVRRGEPEGELAWFSALVPVNEIERLVKKTHEWDLRIGDGGPCVWQTFGAHPKQQYEAFGNSCGIEPLAIRRSFSHNRPSSIELAQEFRLYHNLFDERKTRRFLIADSDGNESVAARYTDDNLEIRTDLLLNFCTIKQMAIAVYVSGFAYSKHSLDELKLDVASEINSGIQFTYSYSLNHWEHFSGDNRKTIARILGKKYILPGPIPELGSKRPEEYQGFVINANADGTPIRHSCNPDLLANHFGANPGAPNYLTPVFFRLEVLSKYYAEPEKYEVEDGIISCSGAWSVHVDNDNDEYIVAWLGDLGRDLSENERAYWLSYNIPPDGRTISQTNYTRAIRGWFANPTKPDLVFKGSYRRLKEECREVLGWDFFLDLHDADQYCFRALHTPLTENSAEFDDQLINLTKLIVDSLNESELSKGLIRLEKGDQGITKFEKFCAERLPAFPAQHIAFLRELQRLRSTSAAHRKGSRYDKLIADLGLEDRGYRHVFDEIFGKANQFLMDLRSALGFPTD